MWPVPPTRQRRSARLPGPAPVAGSSASRALVSWSGAVCRALVAAVLVALVGLVFWSVAPRVAGFQGHVVVSGSMQPRIVPGDVVLTREVAPQQLQPGQVLLFPDPERPDRLLLHRLVSFAPDGRLVTRGDANQGNDSTPVPAASVIGQAQLRIPYVGLPAYWRAQGLWGHVGLAAGLLAAATVFATRGGARGTTGVPADTGTVDTDDVPSTPTVRPDPLRGSRAAHRTRYRNGRRIGHRVGPWDLDPPAGVGSR